MNQHRPTVADYDNDFYAWTQQQARHLRQLERSGAELPASLDLAHLAEEVEDLGKSDLRGTTSLIRNIMVHLMKAASHPQAAPKNHWFSEMLVLHADLSGYYTPSMRRLVDVAKLWKQARELADTSLREYGREMSPDIPAECPFSLSDFLAPELDIDGKLAHLRTPSS